MIATRVFDALVFDFDGLILDTETPAFDAWCAAYAHFGVAPISRTAWSTSIGRHDADPARFDPMAALLAHAPHVHASEVHAFRRGVRDRMLEGLAVRDGVLRWLHVAGERRVPVAVASSSPLSWVEDHLVARGLRRHFAALVCAGGDLPGKPDPSGVPRGVRPTRGRSVARARVRGLAERRGRGQGGRPALPWPCRVRSPPSSTSHTPTVASRRSMPWSPATISEPATARGAVFLMSIAGRDSVRSAVPASRSPASPSRGGPT